MSAAIKGAVSNWRGTSNDNGERNPATNQYKGLVSFIADIRSARARELEEKRINKELANIRSVVSFGSWIMMLTLRGLDRNSKVETGRVLPVSTAIDISLRGTAE